MSEATGHEAKTIHRMLEFSMQKAGFHEKEHPLECDLLIVDEASMIDTVLMHHLLKAIPPRATFVLVGDVNQLPSVGAGNVLKDIIASGAGPVVELNEVFRQAKESRIIVNAHFAEAVTVTATQAVETAQQLLDLSNQDRDKISGLGRAAAPTLQIHRALMEHPIATAGSLVEKTRITPAMVNKALGHLEQLGIVKELTAQRRNRLFS